MKSGYVALIGRPNSGKSTLVNNILKQKVSITSPKPQTTRLPIQAVYQDDRGQIIFIDTPGIFAKIKDPVSSKINPKAESVLKEGVEVIVYLIDHTRERDLEENKTLGIVRNINKPKILTINKIDIKKPTYLPHYKFLEDEFEKVIEVSALYRTNLNLLVEAIFELLPEGERIVDTKNLAYPALNIDSKKFIAEIVREKAYLFLRKEIPYSLATIVDQITEKEKNLTYIKARILTTSDKYKKMIIGKRAAMIKEIGMAARKELEVATNRKIYLDLTVEVNPHWYEELI